MWKELDEEGRKPYVDMSLEDRARYDREVAQLDEK